MVFDFKGAISFEIFRVLVTSLGFPAPNNFIRPPTTAVGGQTNPAQHRPVAISYTSLFPPSSPT